jgi:hypothetical protein
MENKNLYFSFYLSSKHICETFDEDDNKPPTRFTTLSEIINYMENQMIFQWCLRELKLERIKNGVQNKIK